MTANIQADTQDEWLDKLTKKHIGHLLPVTYDEHGNYDEPAILEYYAAILSKLQQQQTELLARVERVVPESRTYTEARDIADHWGMTESSIARQIDNMKSLGRNEAVAEFRAALKVIREEIGR